MVVHLNLLGQGKATTEEKGEQGVEKFLCKRRQLLREPPLLRRTGLGSGLVVAVVFIVNDELSGVGCIGVVVVLDFVASPHYFGLEDT